MVQCVLFEHCCDAKVLSAPPLRLDLLSSRPPAKLIILQLKCITEVTADAGSALTIAAIVMCSITFVFLSVGH